MLGYLGRGRRRVDDGDGSIAGTEIHYENWIRVIYSSNQVITPECGCTHIASACKVPVIIIYDSDNLPEAIYKEYHPWNSEHKKLIFGDMELNEKIFNNLI